MPKARAKAATQLVKLVSSANTGYFYVKPKNPRRIPHKLTFNKFDPRVRPQHLLRRWEFTLRAECAFRAQVNRRVPFIERKLK